MLAFIPTLMVGSDARALLNAKGFVYMLIGKCLNTDLVHMTIITSAVLA